MAMLFSSDHIKVLRKESRLPPLLNGENVVLRLMECLTPTVSFDIFTDNYFISFRLFVHFGVNNIRTTGILNKNRLRKCTIIGDNQLQKIGTV